MTLINLNQAVLNALNFFAKNPPAKLNLPNWQLPLVVGSGNAYNAGLILFADRPAILANESNFQEIISNYENLIEKKIIDTAVIISASGGKLN